MRRSLDELRNTLRSHKEFSPERAELTMTVACTDYIEAAVILPLALALGRSAPGIRLAVRHLNPTSLDHQLATGDVDLAIAAPSFAEPHHRTGHLFEETYVLITRRGHPLARANLMIDEFIQLEQVVVSPSGGNFTTPIDDALAALGYRRKVVMSAASFLFVPEIVSASDLVALVPRRLLRRPHDNLELIEVPWLMERFSIGLIWNERGHNHAGQRWVRELIVELVSSEAPHNHGGSPEITS